MLKRKHLSASSEDDGLKYKKMLSNSNMHKANNLFHTT
jgi:hypothetical protein